MIGTIRYEQRLKDNIIYIMHLDYHNKKHFITGKC